MSNVVQRFWILSKIPGHTNIYAKMQPPRVLQDDLEMSEIHTQAFETQLKYKEILGAFSGT